MKQVNLRIYKAILPLLMGLFISLGAYAQLISVKGHVKDAVGEPVIGANIIVKGTTNGTITDFDGNFTLMPPRVLFCLFPILDINPQKWLLLLR